ncbi:LemA family protein [Candidatus Giovannonibacteria bacterium]|nr:LemA family protein [Candidatus Giovannonibacteria bacterium]
MNTLYIILGALVLVVLWIVAMYNGLIRLKNRAKEAWSDIEVQLKRRYDLIPNLVETVKGYATHESQAFENVTRARAEALKGGASHHEQAEKENMLTGALKSIFAVAEAYPDLKANTNFLELQRELSDTENKIQAARRFYNGNVLALNTKIETVPTNVIAGMFGFQKEEFFDLDGTPEQREPVAVKF